MYLFMLISAQLMSINLANHTHRVLSNVVVHSDR